MAPATTADGTRAVLKLRFPGDREAAYEADALAAWSGRGAVRLLAADRERSAILVERCEPGGSLWEVKDDREATLAAAGVLRELWAAKPAADAPFGTLAAEARRWAEDLPGRWERSGRPFARELLDRAVSLAADLGASQPETVLCHQDLHGGNVLDAGPRGRLAIDPKPLVGERAFDVASLLRDRRPWLLRAADPGRVVTERLDLLCAELGLDRERALGWAVVHAVAWGFGEDEALPDLVASAQLLASLR